MNQSCRLPFGLWFSFQLFRAATAEKAEPKSPLVLFPGVLCTSCLIGRDEIVVVSISFHSKTSCVALSRHNDFIQSVRPFQLLHAHDIFAIGLFGCDQNRGNTRQEGCIHFPLSRIIAFASLLQFRYQHKLARCTNSYDAWILLPSTTHI